MQAVDVDTTFGHFSNSQKFKGNLPLKLLAVGKLFKGQIPSNPAGHDDTALSQKNASHFLFLC